MNFFPAVLPTPVKDPKGFSKLSFTSLLAANRLAKPAAMFELIAL
jgi:hypothetical protein